MKVVGADFPAETYLAVLLDASDPTRKDPASPFGGLNASSFAVRHSDAILTHGLNIRSNSSARLN
jgi:hypothetical protein